MNVAPFFRRFVYVALALAIVASTLPLHPVVVAPLPNLPYSSTYVEGRHRLADDPHSGRLIEVVGDLITASHVAVMVPGVGESRANFSSHNGPFKQGAVPETLLDRARNLYDEIVAQDRTAKVAVIAWLGYIPPAGIDLSALNVAVAKKGSVELPTLRAQLPARAAVTWVCHSYGTVVCANAAASNTADQIVLLASPGVSANSVADLNTRAKIWTGRSEDDPIRHTRYLNLMGLGFGKDPARSGFGARVIPTEQQGGHSGYFRVGGITVVALAEIVRTATPTSAEKI